MYRPSLLTLLSTNTLAGPLLTSDSTIIPRSPSTKSSYLTACEAADNCETYLDPVSGQTKIRFKSGMEPGSADYETRVGKSYAKPQSGYPPTQVTVSDATILWGCDVDPVATLNNVSSICATSGQYIDNSPWIEDVLYGIPGKDGLQTAMSANGLVDTQPVNYIVTTGPTNKNGPQTTGYSCTVAKAPSFVGLGVYSADNVLEATISVSASIGTPATGFCASGVAQTSALTGAIAGAFGPVGAGIGAIFGTISAVCALTPSDS